MLWASSTIPSQRVLFKCQDSDINWPKKYRWTQAGWRASQPAPGTCHSDDWCAQRRAPSWTQHCPPQAIHRQSVIASTHQTEIIQTYNAVSFAGPRNAASIDKKPQHWRQELILYTFANFIWRFTLGAAFTFAWAGRHGPSHLSVTDCHLRPFQLHTLQPGLDFRERFARALLYELVDHT